MRRRSRPARCPAGREAPRARDAERNAGLTDLVFGTHEPLAHGGGRDEERRCDGFRVQPQHHLQHQWRADAGLDRGMRAGEHQPKTPVGNLRGRRRGVSPSATSAPLIGRDFASCAVAAPNRWSCAAPPSAATLPDSRAAIQRPIGERRRECLRQRVLGRGHIARAGGEKGDELAVAAARHRFRRVPGLLVAFASRSCLMPQMDALRRRRDSWRGSAPPMKARHRDRPRR